MATATRKRNRKGNGVAVRKAKGEFEDRCSHAFGVGIFGKGDIRNCRKRPLRFIRKHTAEMYAAQLVDAYNRRAAKLGWTTRARIVIDRRQLRTESIVKRAAAYWGKRTGRTDRIFCMNGWMDNSDGVSLVFHPGYFVELRHDEIKAMTPAEIVAKVAAPYLADIEKFASKGGAA